MGSKLRGQEGAVQRGEAGKADSNVCPTWRKKTYAERRDPKKKSANTME